MVRSRRHDDIELARAASSSSRRTYRKQVRFDDEEPENPPDYDSGKFYYPRVYPVSLSAALDPRSYPSRYHSERIPTDANILPAPSGSDDHYAEHEVFDDDPVSAPILRTPPAAASPPVSPPRQPPPPFVWDKSWRTIAYAIPLFILPTLLLSLAVLFITISNGVDFWGHKTGFLFSLYTVILWLIVGSMASICIENQTVRALGVVCWMAVICWGIFWAIPNMLVHGSQSVFF